MFSYGEKEKERFNRILKYYEGTLNFHNFTRRTKAYDPAAKRYIISFNANTVVNVQGIKFENCEVIGVVNNYKSNNNVNSTGAGDSPDLSKTIVEAGLGAANNDERTDNVDYAGAGLAVTETVAQVDLGSINNGESTDNVSSTGDGLKVVKTVVEAI
ncbi:hypothetical protein CQW23_21658 [Capsicum baccatum]|uniref:Uncharacterized protein n=1 Tax=Capsicum baccatum TaxID=33114 RepID=A0A2G2VYN1_CAPBA|nr:hypothetical protein CQW23_21658 [Capsicum baccatum]